MGNPIFLCRHILNLFGKRLSLNAIFSGDDIVLNDFKLGISTKQKIRDIEGILADNGKYKKIIIYLI